jgi:hypothetical protein
MKRFLRDNGLTLFFLVIFLGALAGQAIAGHADFNESQLAHNSETISFGRYLTSSDFAVDMLENWQSEYLQFTLYLMATVWLLQRGSSESKEPGKEGRESDEEQKVGRHADERSPRWARAGGWRTRTFSNSLLLVMTAIWLLSWVGQAIAGRVVYNADRFDHHEQAVGFIAYIGRPDFWSRTLQNWQSEFLAVGSFAIFAVFLRQRGSPESKPVGASHEATGVQG